MWSKWKILGPREISRSQWMASWSIQRSTKDWVKNNSFMGSGFSLNSDRFTLFSNRLRLRITLTDVEMILPNLGAGSQWLSAKKELFLPKDKDSWRQRPRIGRTKLGEFFFEFPKGVLNFSLLQEGGATGMIFCTYDMMTLRKWRPKLPLWCKHWVIQPNLRREILKPVLRTPWNQGASAPFCRSGQYAPLLALSDWKAKRLSYRNLPTTSPHL